MGVEFLRDKRMQHRKAWNLPMMARVDDLFSASVQQPVRVIRATLESGTFLKSGSEVSFGIAAADLHLFDPASGKAIAHGGSLA